jgi:hypothetical protein
MFGRGGRLWEGGDLERLSLVDDEEPIKPQEVFSHVSVVNKSKVCYWRREWSFCKPRYVTLTTCSRKVVNNVSYSMLGVISW